MTQTLPAVITPDLSTQIDELQNQTREARARLDTFERLGPTAEAFDFKTPFPPPR